MGKKNICWIFFNSKPIHHIILFHITAPSHSGLWKESCYQMLGECGNNMDGVEPCWRKLHVGTWSFTVMEGAGVEEPFPVKMWVKDTQIWDTKRETGRVWNGDTQRSAHPSSWPQAFIAVAGEFLGMDEILRSPRPVYSMWKIQAKDWTNGIQGSCSWHLSLLKLKEHSGQIQSITKPESCRISEFCHHRVLSVPLLET